MFINIFRRRIMLKSLTKKIRKSKSGFTLIELIVVVAILAILAAILIPVVGGQISTAKANASNSDAQAAFTAAQLWQTNQQAATTNGTPIPASEVVTSTDGSTFTATPTSAAAVTNVGLMLNSSEFKNIKGLNGFELQSITTDSNGTITQIKMVDNNKSTQVAWPQ